MASIGLRNTLLDSITLYESTGVVIPRFAPEGRIEIWNRFVSGQPVRSMTLRLGLYLSDVHKLVMSSGGAPSIVIKSRSPHFLNLAEHEEISGGVMMGLFCRAFATALIRAPSATCRGNHTQRIIKRRTRPPGQRDTIIPPRPAKMGKLALSLMLRAVVETRREERWSPQQISAWLSTTDPKNRQTNLSHDKNLYLLIHPRS